MNKILLSMIGLLLLAMNAQAQLYYRFAYQVSAPLAQMNQNIGKNAQGIVAELGVRIPKTPLTLGWHWGLAQYGYQQTKELHVFAQGAQSNVFVDVNNFFTQSHFFMRYDLPTKGIVSPYLSVGLGKSHFRTMLEIFAETSTPECPKPLETAFPLKDKVTHYMMAGGVKVELAKILRFGRGKSFCLDFQVQHTRGGEVTYMNVRKTPIVQPNTTPVYTKFASQAKPSVIHQYYAGNSYSSSVRLLTFQLGFSYTGNWKPKKRLRQNL